MSRSGYSDEIEDQWVAIRWRGAVRSALQGQHGQAALTELLSALEAMPEKRLIAKALEQDGEYCTLGILGKARALPLQDVDPYDPEAMAALFGLAQAMVREIAYENDEPTCKAETPEQRWSRMRTWVAKQVKPCSPPLGGEDE